MDHGSRMVDTAQIGNAVQRFPAISHGAVHKSGAIPGTKHANNEEV
jgi:hypothetical protein